MIKIRRLSFLDYKEIKKLISYLCTEENETYTRNIFEESISFINGILPLKLKFKPESYILLKDKEILGLITASCTYGNPHKINITRLIFKQNDYETGKELVEFIIHKFGGKGAQSFIVSIDDSHDELFNLFINGCGFRQCGSETLWKAEDIKVNNTNLKYRRAQNDDSKNITQMYNAEINNIFKPSLIREPKEFQEPIFYGFNKYYKLRYLEENEQNIISYFSVTTYDNLNYIIDITTNSGYETDYNTIINSALSEISKKRKNFYPFIKQKNYTLESEKFGNYLKESGYMPIQVRHILVKDFYKVVKQEGTEWKMFVLSEGINISQ